MQTVIENNILLSGVRDDLREIAKKQDANHVITLALKEHATIERVDSLWQEAANTKFLLKILIGVAVLIPSITGLIVILSRHG